MQADSGALKVAYADQVQIARSYVLPEIAVAGMHQEGCLLHYNHLYVNSKPLSYPTLTPTASLSSRKLILIPNTGIREAAGLDRRSHSQY